MKKLLMSLLTLLLVSCAHKSVDNDPLVSHNGYKVDLSHPSQSQNQRVTFWY